MSSQRAAGGQDIKVKGRLATARVLASGEEWFVLASSRIVLSVCRLILAAALPVTQGAGAWSHAVAQGTLPVVLSSRASGPCDVHMGRGGVPAAWQPEMRPCIHTGALWRLRLHRQPG